MELPGEGLAGWAALRGSGPFGVCPVSLSGTQVGGGADEVESWEMKWTWEGEPDYEVSSQAWKHMVAKAVAKHQGHGSCKVWESIIGGGGGAVWSAAWGLVG